MVILVGECSFLCSAADISVFGVNNEEQLQELALKILLIRAVRCQKVSSANNCRLEQCHLSWKNKLRKLSNFMIFLSFFFFVAVSCSNPGTPANGHRQGDDFSYGSQVTYSCDDRFVLDGDMRRSCQQNGVWTGRQPSCLSKKCLMSFRQECYFHH